MSRNVRALGMVDPPRIGQVLWTMPLIVVWMLVIARLFIRTACEDGKSVILSFLDNTQVRSEDRMRVVGL